MIAALALLAASALPLDELPPQRLAPQRCALFLWDRDSQRRIAMATSGPAALTIARDGRTRTLAGAADDGAPVLGFTPRAVYRGDGLIIATDLAIEPTDVGGAVVRDGTLTMTLADGTAIVAPVAGLIGCQ